MLSILRTSMISCREDMVTREQCCTTFEWFLSDCSKFGSLVRLGIGHVPIVQISSLL